MFEDDLDEDEPAAEEALRPDLGSDLEEDDLESEDGSDDEDGDGQGNEFDAMLAEGGGEDESDIDSDLLDEL